MTKILVSPHRIDTDIFRPARKVPGMVLFVGRLSPEKRVSGLVEAVRCLPWARLHIVGDGPEHGILEALALSLRVAVTWHGFLPQRAVAEIMAQAQHFVLASRYEQASKVLLEAMASGCLVIATPEASRGIVADGQTGYLCDPSPEGIRRALDRAHTDSMANSIRQAARTYIQAVSVGSGLQVACRQTGGGGESGIVNRGAT